MIKDFNMIKKQLQDLAGVINCFKSESVQLKVGELVFERSGIEAEGEIEEERPPKQRKKTESGRKEKTRETKPKKKKQARPSSSGRPGPGAIVNQLIQEGFFKKPKTISDIVDHCKAKHAYTYNTNELAPAMTRALRKKQLKRKRNEQKQFEYTE